MSRLLRRHEAYLLAVVLLYAVVVTAVNPAFLSLEYLTDMVRGGCGTMILAVGVLVVLLSGGIDVSFTAVAIAGGYVATRVLLATRVDSLALAFAISGAIGLALGAINGLLIARLRIPTFIATLGTSSVFFGVMTTFVGTRSVNAGQMPSALTAFGSASLVEFTSAGGDTYGLTVFVIPVVLIVVVTWFLLQRTMLGRGIFAIGNSPEAAMRAGFDVPGIQLFLYVYVGLLAGIMGVIFVAEVHWVNPVSLVGSELTVIAAAVIGGAKLTGGEGTLFGTFLGVTIFVLLNNTLVLLGLSSSWNGLFVGVILIVSVGMTSLQARRQARQTLSFRA